MKGDAFFEEINEAKANLDDVYDQPDPRAYFSEVEKFGYAIPGTAKPVFQKMISQLRNEHGGSLRVLDLGCSYGVNAALLKYDLSMADLYDHWAKADTAGASSAEVVERDRRFFASLEPVKGVEVVGLDQAGNAIDYACKVGLLDDGYGIDLERKPVPDAAKDSLANVDLVVSTGCVGYVTEKTFEHLLPVITQGGAPWMAHFVLRMFPFGRVERCLDQHGYKTEKIEGRTFVQRRFATPQEQAQVVGQLRGQGCDPAGLEANGHLLAELYISRPTKDADAMPVNGLLPS